MSSRPQSPLQYIILFDGDCAFCDRSVRFVAARDRRARFRFASLQSDSGRELLRAHGLPEDQLDTMVVIESDEHFLRSAAGLRVALRLGFPWSVLWSLIIVPRPVRDWCYIQFAARRYRWFGRRDHCVMPTAELRERLLD